MCQLLFLSVEFTGKIELEKAKYSWATHYSWQDFCGRSCKASQDWGLKKMWILRVFKVFVHHRDSSSWGWKWCCWLLSYMNDKWIFRCLIAVQHFRPVPHQLQLRHQKAPWIPHWRRRSQPFWICTYPLHQLFHILLGKQTNMHHWRETSFIALVSGLACS